MDLILQVNPACTYTYGASRINVRTFCMNVARDIGHEGPAGLESGAQQDPKETG